MESQEGQAIDDEGDPSWTPEEAENAYEQAGDDDWSEVKWKVWLFSEIENEDLLDKLVWFASLGRSLSEEIVNDEPFPQHFTVMIHCFYNTLCTVYVFLSYLFWLEESRCVIFLCRVGHVTLYLMALERNGEITRNEKLFV